MEEELSSACDRETQMNILLWHPTYVLGGGYLLLVQLLEALGRHPGVTTITAAIHKDYRQWITSDQFPAKVKQILVESGTPIESVLGDQDVVYMVWPHGVSIPRISTPTVCVYQDTILLDAYGAHSTDTFLKTMEQAVKETVSKYSKVIVTSNYTQQRFLEIVGAGGMNKVAVLPHIATDPNLKVLPFSGREENVASGRVSVAARRSGLDYLIYPANVSEHKNHLALMIAMSKRQRKDTSLVLCGYGTDSIGKAGVTPNPYLNRLNKTIMERGLQSGSDYQALGYVEDTKADELMDGALGLIMPTRAEGMGLPIHEAIERGLPIIASDLPVLREHFADRSDAILWVDPESPLEIAQAWDYLCDHHEDMCHMASKSRGCGVTWADVADKTFRILEEEVRRTPRTLHVPGIGMVGRMPRRRWLKKVEKSIKRLWRRAG